MTTYTRDQGKIKLEQVEMDPIHFICVGDSFGNQDVTIFVVCMSSLRILLISRLTPGPMQHVLKQIILCELIAGQYVDIAPVAAHYMCLNSQYRFIRSPSAMATPVTAAPNSAASAPPSAEFLSLSFDTVGASSVLLRAQTNDSDPRSLLRLCRKCGYETSGAPVTSNDERTTFALKAADGEE